MDQEKLTELMRQAGLHAGMGQMNEALDLWAVAAEHDVPEAYINIARLFERSCASSTDVLVKQDYCKQLVGLLDEATVTKFGIADLPLTAAIALSHTAAYMDTNDMPAADVYNYYNAAAHFYQQARRLPQIVDPMAKAIATNGMACLIVEGNGVDKNEILAYGLFSESAQKHHFGEAMFNLAILHYHGKGCEKSLPHARDFCALALRFIPDDYFNAELKPEVREALETITDELAGKPSRTNGPLVIFKLARPLLN